MSAVPKKLVSSPPDLVRPPKGSTADEPGPGEGWCVSSFLLTLSIDMECSRELSGVEDPRFIYTTEGEIFADLVLTAKCHDEIPDDWGNCRPSDILPSLDCGDYEQWIERGSYDRRGPCWDEEWTFTDATGLSSEKVNVLVRVYKREHKDYCPCPGKINIATSTYKRSFEKQNSCCDDEQARALMAEAIQFRIGQDITPLPDCCTEDAEGPIDDIQIEEGEEETDPQTATTIRRYNAIVSVVEEEIENYINGVYG